MLAFAASSSLVLFVELSSQAMEMFYLDTLANRTRTDFLHLANIPAVLPKGVPVALLTSASMSRHDDPLAVPSTLFCGLVL